MTSVPIVGTDAIFRSISAADAIAAVRNAFLKHHRGEWKMPSKVYLDASPHGDFRAMPALGEGLAILKWVTSFPGNPAHGRPVVYGTIAVSDAVTGEPKAIVDGRAVTALRTGAAAAVATEVLRRDGAATAGLIGCGLHGRWAALCLKEIGLSSGVCADVDDAAAQRLAGELGWTAGSREEAVAADVLTLVTPGESPVVHVGELRGGTHVNALGADGSGKAEMEVAEVERCQLFVDEWDQASHGGELAGAVEQGKVNRLDVAEIGAVLAGEAPGRGSDEAITLFDSTGLAIQDLAIVVEVMKALDGGRIAFTEADI